MSVMNRPLRMSLLPALLLTSTLIAQVAGQQPAPRAQEPKQQPSKNQPGQEPGQQQPAASKIDFRKQIWPILEGHCIECHRAPYVDEETGRRRRPKGRVELDSAAGIKKSKRGKLVVAKDPEQSLLIAAVTLPADDEDRMPPAKEGPPLQPKQIELLTKWIEQGADFGTWVSREAEAEQARQNKKDGDNGKGGEPGKGAGPGKGAEPGKAGGKPGGKTVEQQGKAGAGGARDRALTQLARDLEPLAAAELTALRAVHAAAVPVTAGSPLLRVTFYGHEAEVTDATLAALQPAREHVAELVLARTRVTDRGLDHLRGMPRLLRLDLRQTAVGDGGMATVAALPALQELNLFATAVSDEGLAALAAAPALTELHLWQSDASARGVVALRRARPDTRVVFLPALPEPVAADQTPTPRRRR